MSRIEDLLVRSSAEVRDAVQQIPDQEVMTVAAAHNRKTMLTAAGAIAGVVIVVLLGWALFGLGGDEPAPIDQPDDPIPVESDATPLPAAPARINADTYVTSVLGPAFSFRVDNYGADDGWFLQIASPVEVAISHPLSEGPGDRDMWFGHPDALSDPEDPFVAGWPIDDLDGWLDANSGWVVDEPVGTWVGGRSATRFALAGADPCRDPSSPSELPCPALVFDGDEGAMWLVDGARYEVWWVHDVGGSPFVIAAGAASWTDEFRANVEAIVATWAAGTADGGAAIEAGADLRWEYCCFNGEPVVLAGDLPDGFPARTWVGDSLDDQRGTDVDGLFLFSQDREPPVPLPIVEILAILDGDGVTGNACADLGTYVSDQLAPQDRESAGALIRAEVFTRFAAAEAERFGCLVGEWGTDGTPPPIAGDASEPVGDPGALVAEAERIADESGNEQLIGTVDIAASDGTLDFSGDPEDAAANILEFDWRVSRSHPVAELLPLFVDPDGPAGPSWAESDVYGSGAVLIPTDPDREAEVSGFEEVPRDEWSASDAAAAPDDAAMVRFISAIPELDVVAADGSVVRTVPERLGAERYVILTPSETGWRIWAEG